MEIFGGAFTSQLELRRRKRRRKRRWRRKEGGGQCSGEWRVDAATQPPLQLELNHQGDLLLPCLPLLFTILIIIIIIIIIIFIIRGDLLLRLLYDQ